MKKLVTIGGGDINSFSTLAIDREVIRLTGKKHPRFLFVPTASSDDMDYWNGVDTVYRKRCGCKTDVLYLLSNKITRLDIKNKILSADIIYVGGGNTLKMIRRWRFLGVDKLLKNVWEKGIVLCGISAGSICWYDSGHSDSISYYNPNNWNYINVKGLGFIKGIHCPHYDSATLGVKRKSKFHNMIQKMSGFGIAIQDNCAIEYIDNKFRVLTSKPHAKAFKVYKRKGKIIETEIEKSERLIQLSQLYTKE